MAQIYGVGLITSYLTGIAFELGIFLGLGGILVCSFLGGMRAVTWTQVAQYIILVVAYLIPVVWLSVKQTGVPVPQLVYGFQLEKVTAKEKELIADPKEQQVRALYGQHSDALLEKLKHPEESLAADRLAANKQLESLKNGNASVAAISAAGKVMANMPRDEAAAVKAGPLPRLRPRARPGRSMACRRTPRNLQATRMVRPRSRRCTTLRAEISWHWSFA